MSDDVQHRRARRTRAPRPRPRSLVEALPWLKRFHGKIVVVKYGGNAMTDDELKRAFAEDIVFLRYAGLQPGRRARRRPADLADARPARHRERVPRRPAGHHARGDGRRPDGAGRPGQRELVGLINEHGPLAVGLSGEDAGLFTARKRAAPSSTARTVDIGLVGDVVDGRPGGRPWTCSTPAASRSSPPSRPIDVDGQVYNVNADTAAAALAVALGRREARRPHRRRGPLRATGPTSDELHQPADAPPSSRSCCRR